MYREEFFEIPMADTIDRVLIVGDSILGSTTKEILVKTCLQNSVKIQFFDSADTHVEEIIHFDTRMTLEIRANHMTIVL